MVIVWGLLSVSPGAPLAQEGDYMCQAKVYLANGDAAELVAEDVIMLEEVPEGVRLATFFDEPQLVRARVSSIDFLKHIVSLVPLEEAAHG